MKFLVRQQPAFVYTGGKPFDAARPTLVFVHGAANDHSVWTYPARYFAHHGWNVMAVDLPGHGRSFGAWQTSVGDTADWLADLLDHGGIARAAIVGHSMGALVALDFGLRHVQRASRLALLGASVPMPVSDVLLDAAQHRPREAFDMVNLWGHAPRLKWSRNPTPGTSSLMSYRALLRQSPPGVLASDLQACAAYQPPEEALRRLAVPALILAGAEDMMTPPKAGRVLAGLLPSARFTAIAGCGHCMMLEAPGETIAHLADFLRETD